MSVKKILIFNPFGIGDVLFTTPLVRNLKELLPQVEVSYICNGRAYPILKHNKFLTKLWVFEKDQWRKILKQSKWQFIKQAISFFWTIRQEKFDVVFDLSLNSQYGFFLKMCAIKKRIGYNFKNRARFLTHTKSLSDGYKNKHVSSYYLDLLEFLNLTGKEYKFDLFIPDNLLFRAQEILKHHNLDKNSLIIGISPGAGDSWGNTAYYKRWPLENFITLVEQLQRDLKAKVIIFGAHSEKSICDDLENSLKEPVINLCGKLDLEEFAAVLKFCKVFITNEGGPFHIGQALGIKTIVLVGPVDEKVYGCFPANNKNCQLLIKDIPCRPCYQRFRFPTCTLDKQCLRDILVDDVYRKVKELLALKPDI